MNVLVLLSLCINSRLKLKTPLLSLSSVFVLLEFSLNWEFYVSENMKAYASMI